MEDARNRFREGWVMLRRGFVFGELPQPLFPLTIFYAYKSKHVSCTSKEGLELLDEIYNPHYRSPYKKTIL